MINWLLRKVGIDPEAINAEIERQSRAWTGE